MALRTQSSFAVQFAAAVAVAVIFAWWGVTTVEWCLLALCITVVLAAEAFNTALEHLARAITREHNPQVRDALDVAAGAVLIASLGASVVGCLLVAQRLLN